MKVRQLDVEAAVFLISSLCNILHALLNRYVWGDAQAENGGRMSCFNTDQCHLECICSRAPQQSAYQHERLQMTSPVNLHDPYLITNWICTVRWNLYLIIDLMLKLHVKEFQMIFPDIKLISSCLQERARIQNNDTLTQWELAQNIGCELRQFPGAGWDQPQAGRWDFRWTVQWLTGGGRGHLSCQLPAGRKFNVQRFEKL